MSSPTTAPSGAEESPPYPNRYALLGGTPTTLPDLPPTIILLILFTLSLLLHLLALHLDHYTHTHHHRPHTPTNKPTHRLLPILLILFPLTRIAALATRIAWTRQPDNRDLEIASSLLTPAGTVLLLIVNVMLARRFLRDYAAFGLHTGVLRVARAVVFVAGAALVMLVSVGADVYFTRDEEALRECRVIGLVASCILVAVAVVPGVVVIVGGWVLPAEREVERDRRRERARAGMIGIASVLLTVVEGFRCGVMFEGREAGSQAWFLHKACFYCLGFLLELVVVYMFLFARVDSRFRLRPRLGEKTGLDAGTSPRYARWADRVNTRAEVFGDVGLADRVGDDARDLEALTRVSEG